MLVPARHEELTTAACCFQRHVCTQVKAYCQQLGIIIRV